MIIGIPKETYPSERRVAVIPAHIPLLHKAEHRCLIEQGAGTTAGFPDEMYTEQGAELVSREALFQQAELILQVRTAGANPDLFGQDVSLLRAGQTLIGFMEPLWRPQTLQLLAETGADAFAIELMPRITRAQNMDALSSMATIAGYKAVLLAANRSPQMFPLLMTAAGTITPVRVFVLGAGVAGLQAMATAKRLGATVDGYDVRAAAREQVESVGARFIELDLEVGDAETKGGYAKALDEEIYQRQQELMTPHIARSDVVITTAAVPGKPAPKLISRRMVATMRPGSVIIDIAAEWGGNCELTRAGETVVEHGVSIVGAVNLASTVPMDASMLYSRNLFNFVQHLSKIGALPVPDPATIEEEIARETLVVHNGQIVNERVRKTIAKNGG